MILDIPRKRRGSPRHKTTTIRQFDGGWNVVDNELTLSPRYARIYDNMVRGSDASVSVRYGYALWTNLKLGTETTYTPSVTLTTTAGATARRVTVNWTAHGLLDDQHITFSGLSSYQGIPVSELNRTHSVRVVNANSFEIITATAATGAGTSSPMSVTAVRDTHIAADIVNAVYFQNAMIAVTSAGEVIKIDASKVATVIWNNRIAYALSGNPIGWGPTDFVSFNMFGGFLHLHNGIDKPLEIDTTRTIQVVFLGDPASGGSNTFVPVGSIGLSSGGFMEIAGIPGSPGKLQISASLASGVWTGNPSPDDATDVELSKITSALDPEIMGLAELRDKLMVMFRDATVIGTLGLTKTVGTTIVHDPTFKDSIPQHGCISHRSIVALGNDLFMCDRTGVPSVGQSLLSGQFVPDRVSDLIEPAIQRNINRLSDTTLRKKVFAVFNSQDKQYMLFMPKYDTNDVRSLASNPITFGADFPSNSYMMTLPSHGLETGDTIIISGAINIGNNLAVNINGTHTVGAVLNDDTFLVTTDTIFPVTDITGGGASVTIQPISQETIGYIYSYNPKLKVHSWSRYRGMNFDWALKSPNGYVFAGKYGKIYRLGSKQIPYYADKVGDYDAYSFANNHAYTTGYRVYDSTENTVYVALKDHTSPSTGSFLAARAADTSAWEEYYGDPINYIWEWPWGDFDRRLKTKAIAAIYPDTNGSGQFSIKLFVDQIYKNAAGALNPVRTLDFTAGDAPGYGAGDQPYGGGRRTKEQLLWPVSVIAKLVKLRIEGSTTDPLSFIAISIVYKEGSMKR